MAAGYSSQQNVTESIVPPKCGVHCRLAKHYQLQIVTARTILAAAEELGGTIKQVRSLSRMQCRW